MAEPNAKPIFATPGTPTERENGTAFTPVFDAEGLIPCIASDADSGEVVMFAWMNRDALAATLTTGIAHYWSRSRRALWQKGETSGNHQRVVAVRTDCDQDAIWISVRTEGSGANCHLGQKSCFFRAIEKAADGSWRLIADDRPPLFDPASVYGKR
ncbi:MAG: phosphoribosyl-AMP cyclohydrolase [Bauldia sp.]